MVFDLSENVFPSASRDFPGELWATPANAVNVKNGCQYSVYNVRSSDGVGMGVIRLWL